MTNVIHLGLALAIALPTSTVAQAAVPDLTQPLPGRVRGGYMSASNIRLLPRMKAVGLNAAIVKFGGIESELRRENQETLARWAEACTNNDLAFMPAFNLFGGHEPAWVTDFVKYVDKDGVVYEQTPCPFDPEFWDRFVTPRFVAIAEALRGKNLAAICLDVEMYGADISGYPGPCYCDECYPRFIKSRGQAAAPLPDRAQRAAALAEAGLEQAYRDFQASQIETHARKCRQALHRIQPKTRIGVFHLDWDTSFHHGLARGFGTQELPVICLTERTYSSGYTDYIRAAQAHFRESGAYVDLFCGIWHSKFPAQNVSEHYYYCAKASLGYWIYTMETFEQPTYSPLPEDHEAYWAAIKLANSELDKLAANPDYQTHLRIRPFEMPITPLTTAGFEPVSLVPYNTEAKPGEHPRLRGTNTLYFYVTKGEQIAFEISFRQIGQYHDRVQCLLVTPDGEEIARAEIKRKQPARLETVAGDTGVYAILVGTGANACEVTRASHPYAFKASGKRGASLISKLPPLFLLCHGSRQVVLWLQTEGPGEAVQVKIKTDTDTVVYEGRIVGPKKIEPQLPRDTKYLVVSFEKLPNATMEDLRIGVEAGLYPFASTSLAGLLCEAD